MTLAQARSVLPALIARGRDPVSERSAHEALLETAWTLSPWSRMVPRGWPSPT